MANHFYNRFRRHQFKVFQAIVLCACVFAIACQSRSAQESTGNGQTVMFRAELPLEARPKPRWQPNATGFLKPLSEDAPNSGFLPETLGFDEQLWGLDTQADDRALLLQSIDYSLQYLASAKAAADYRGYPIPGITQERVIRSLERFRELVETASTPQELQLAVFEEFTFYQSVGTEGFGDVLFTAYFEPVYAASRVPTAEYRYPLYGKPPDLDAWPRPHPTRGELEGKDGLQGENGPLKGLELFWLRDRLEAYLIHIQGSARLELTDGTETTVGYADNTRHDYTSIGAELVEDGKLTLEEAMPIAYSILTVTFTYLIVFPLYYLQKDKYIKRSVQTFILATAQNLFLIIFYGAKIYSLLCQRHKNTKSYFRTQMWERSQAKVNSEINQTTSH